MHFKAITRPCCRLGVIVSLVHFSKHSLLPDLLALWTRTVEGLSLKRSTNVPYA